MVVLGHPRECKTWRNKTRRFTYTGVIRATSGISRAICLPGYFLKNMAAVLDKVEPSVHTVKLVYVRRSKEGIGICFEHTAVYQINRS